MRLTGYSKKDWSSYDCYKKQIEAIKSSPTCKRLPSRIRIEMLKSELDCLLTKIVKDPKDCLHLEIIFQYSKRYLKRIEELKGSKRLSRIDFYENVPSLIPYLELVQSLPNLETITLVGHQLKDVYNYYKDGIGLPIFSNIPTLRSVSIWISKPQDPEHFDFISFPSHLKEFYVTGSVIGAESSISHTISSFTNLERADFTASDEDNPIKKEDVSSYGVWVRDLADKTTLKKCSIDIDELYANDIAKLIENNTSMKELSLANMTDESLNIISHSLSQAASLEHARISFVSNINTNVTLDSLQTIISKNKSIKKLSLIFSTPSNANQILRRLPKILQSNTTLLLCNAWGLTTETTHVIVPINPLLVFVTPYAAYGNYNTYYNDTTRKNIILFNKTASQLLKESRLFLLLNYILPNFMVNYMMDYYLDCFPADSYVLKNVLLDRESIGYLTIYAIQFSYQELIRNCHRYRRTIRN
ncbi:hypothetical protein BC833DRAFT_598393 [Globomyces pollinis-pini]|nr:hypothetical protein BC833DRAFT_598393 [Globomyces pollinis-pini]